MRSVYDKDEMITEDDLFFVCYMVERLSRKLSLHNRDVINQIEPEEWRRLISLADVLHALNPLQVEDDWIRDYQLTEGNYHILDVDPAFTEHIPTDLEMGKVYQRLMLDTMTPDEDYVDAMIRVYNDAICEKLDDYDCGAFYEPSNVIARAYRQGGF